MGPRSSTLCAALPWKDKRALGVDARHVPRRGSGGAKRNGGVCNPLPIEVIAYRLELDY